MPGRGFDEPPSSCACDLMEANGRRSHAIAAMKSSQPTKTQKFEGINVESIDP